MGSNEALSNDPSLQSDQADDADILKSAKDKAKELALDLKSITQLYNEYAVPFKLWEVCLFNLEILLFCDFYLTIA